MIARALTSAGAALWAACLVLVLAVSPVTGQTAPDGQDAGGTQATTGTTPAATGAGDETAPEDMGVGASPAVELAAGVTMPPGSPDYEAWSKVAARAERAIEARRASDEALTALRAEIVDWRSAFSAARSENAVRITTLKDQIAALGEPPAEGKEESQTRASQRAALNEQLALIETPVVVATIAYARADSIISQIDALLRSRTTDTLFATGPSAANPALWTPALAALSSTATTALREGHSALTSDAQQARIRQSFAVLGIFLLLAFVLLLRGRRWIMKLGEKIQSISHGSARGVWAFLTSIAQMVAPILGMFFVLISASILGLMDGRPGYFLDLVYMVVLSTVTARWIGGRVFGQPGSDWAVLNLRSAARSEGRLEATLLGAAYGVWRFIDTVSTAERYSAATFSVLSLIPLAVAAVLMVRLGRLMRAHTGRVMEETEEGEGISFLDRTLGLAGGTLVIIGVIGPIMHLAGYVQFALFLVWSTALSLALIGVLLALHRFYVDVYGLVFRRSEAEAEQALIPVMVSLLTLLIALPVFALIWGARSTELGEIWVGIGNGVALGEVVITPSDLLVLVVVFAAGFGATRLVQGMLKSTVLPKTSIDVGGRNAITSGIGYVGYFLAAVVAITAAGINLSSLAIVAGALSVGVGFGLQTIVSNFVSGIILLIERPISEGDWISVGGNMGIVKDISVRSTRIETFDRQDVVVPNSDFISGTVTNYTRGNKIGRLVLDVGVAYGTNTRRVSEVLMEIAQNHPLVTVNPPPQVTFAAFGADSLDFQIRAVLSDVSMILTVRDEMNHQIAERFAEEGIEIPFAQRDIWLRNPEALRAPPAPATPPARESDAPGDGSRAKVSPVHELPEDYDDGDGDGEGDGD